MRFQGRLIRDGRFWLAEVPMFDAMTQGRSRKEALEMVADWFATMVDRPGFKVEVVPHDVDGFEVGSADTAAMIGLLLQRQRQMSGLTLAAAAERLGAKSRNAFARYEQGVTVPTVGKLDELLRAVAPGREIIISQRDRTVVK